MDYSILHVAIDDNLSIVDAKVILSSFAEQLGQIDKSVAKDVCYISLHRLQARIVSFEEQVRNFLMSKVNLILGHVHKAGVK